MNESKHYKHYLTSLTLSLDIKLRLFYIRANHVLFDRCGYLSFKVKWIQTSDASKRLALVLVMSSGCFFLFFKCIRLKMEIHEKIMSDLLKSPMCLLRYRPFYFYILHLKGLLFTSTKFIVEQKAITLFFFSQ